MRTGTPEEMHKELEYISFLKEIAAKEAEDVHIVISSLDVENK